MSVALFQPSTRAARNPAAATSFVQERGADTVVVVEGASEPSTVFVLSESLARVIARREGNVLIDLTNAEFIDLATARAFAVAQRMLEGQGRRLTFRSPSRVVALVMDLFGLCRLVESPLDKS